MKNILSAILISALAMVGVAHSADPALIDKGKALSTVCAACHGADGNAIAPNFPSLAGQHESYLLKQMRQFKSVDNAPAERLDPVMNPQMAAVSAEDMQALAAFYASQKLAPKPATQPELRAIAEKIYRGGDPMRGLAACASCHGPAGRGMPSQYPSIGGQSAEYLKTQLNNFRAGTRANDVESMMRQSARYLTDKEIGALADYLSGLRLSQQ